MTEYGIIGVVLAAILGTFVTWRKLDSPPEPAQMGETGKGTLGIKFARGKDGKLHLRKPIDLQLRICLSLICGLFPAVLAALYLKYLVGL
jgi:hypothetical protein